MLENRRSFRFPLLAHERISARKSEGRSKTNTDRRTVGISQRGDATSIRGQARGSGSLKWRTVYRGPVNEGLKLPLVGGRETETPADRQEGGLRNWTARVKRRRQRRRQRGQKKETTRSARQTIFYGGGGKKEKEKKREKCHAKRAASAWRRDASAGNAESKGELECRNDTRQVSTVHFRTIERASLEEFLPESIPLHCCDLCRLRPFA